MPPIVAAGPPTSPPSRQPALEEEQASGASATRRWVDAGHAVCRVAGEEDPSALEESLGLVERGHLAIHALLHGASHEELLPSSQLGIEGEGHARAVAERSDRVVSDRTHRHSAEVRWRVGG